jgi:hypothetical protein
MVSAVPEFSHTPEVRIDTTMTSSAAVAWGTGGRRWLGRRGDLPTRPFPSISGNDLTSRLAAVDALRTWAEARAEDAIDWYRRDKRTKRTVSKALRAASIVLAVAGGAVPLANAAWNGEAGGWGYVLLAAAAGGAAFDHFFGISATWMRDMATIQALRNRLDRFRLEWTSDLLLARTAPEVGEEELARRLDLVRDFAEEVTGLIDAEISAWQAEFSANMRELHAHTRLAPTQRVTDGG